MRRHAKAPSMKSTLAVLAACVFGMAFLSPSAFAQKGTVDIFGSTGSEAGELGVGPVGVAVNNASGDVYVADNTNHRMVQFDAAGNFVRTWGLDVNETTPSTGFEICTAVSGHSCKAGVGGEGAGAFSEYSTTGGVAVNQATGNVYVLDMQPLFRVQVFDANGNFVRMWGWDVNASNPSVTFENCTAASGDLCKAGTEGSGGGQFSAISISSPMHLAIDPANGDVVAADGANKRLQRFSANGSFIGVVGSGAQFNEGNSPASVAVDSQGNVYANAIAPTAPGGLIHRFDPTGSYMGTFSPAPAQQVAIAPTNDRVYTTRLNASGDKWQIAEFSPAGNLLSELSTGLPLPHGLAINTLTGRLYVSAAESGQVFAIGDVANPPTATIDPVADVTSSSATLSGGVNPNGSAFNTGYHFEYRAEGSTKWLQVGDETDIGNGVDPIVVSTPLADLDPNTKYRVRLVATRELGAGSGISPEAALTTEPAAPGVTFLAASRVTDSSARLGASLDAKNAATTYYFKYGTDTSYGSSAPLSQSGQGGQALGGRPVFEQISGLMPNTTYHFCLVAENAGGATPCEDQTFTTTTTAEQVWPERKLELVNEPNKGNQSPLPNEKIDTYMTADGERVAWQTTAGTPTSSSGAWAFFISSRTPTGWTTEPFAPTTEQQPPGEHAGDMAYRFAGANPSLTEFLINGTQGFFADAVPNYLIRAGSPEDQEILAFREDKNDNFFTWAGQVQASQNLDHVVVRDPDTEQFMHYGRGDGEPLAVPACGGRFASVERRSASVGVESVFVLSPGDNECGGPEELYVIDLATNTATLISGPATGPQLGVEAVAGIAEDGSGVVFKTASGLIPSDDNEGPDLYRWRNDVGLACLTCSTPAYSAVSKALSQTKEEASPDLSRVYFESSLTIAGAPPAPDCPMIGKVCNLYVLRVDSGQIHFIGQMGRSDVGGTNELISTMTPSGDVYVFNSSLPGMTADEMGVGKNGVAATQLYLYDDLSGVVECVSCRNSAGPNTGSTATTCCHSGRIALSRDGDTVAFNTATPIVPRDINDRQDIYEWHNGVVRLVTDGVHEWPENSVGGAPQTWGLSDDGRDLIIAVGGFSLTGEEKDFYSNVYDARVGGGFPTTASPSRCTEDACQGPLRPPPPLSSQGSSAFVGPGTATARKAKRKKRRQVKKTRTTGKRKAKSGARTKANRGGKGR